MYLEEDLKWNCFEKSGKISDYLEYKKVQYTADAAVGGECKGADENT